MNVPILRPYICSCDQFFAEQETDLKGFPLACVDDDECDDPNACGPDTQCVNSAPGYHCLFAFGSYDVGNEDPEDEVDRWTNPDFANRNETGYVPQGIVDYCTDDYFMSDFDDDEGSAAEANDGQDDSLLEL